MRRTGRALIAAALLVLAVPMGASAFYGPFTGVATGMQIRHTNTASADNSLNNRSTYNGRFTYSFRVDGFGFVSGVGHGVYTSPPDWDLSGTVSGTGFNCQNILVTTTPRFTVDITGNAANGVARLRFRLENAIETNDEYLCGVYTASATTSTYLADSLAAVQDALANDEIVVRFRNPRIGHLGPVVQTDTYSDGSRVVTSDWNITIVPPPPPEDIGGGPGGPGTASGPRDSG
ncbi:MAG TPA: hypothetical protein VES61_06255, partial [Gaiellaceae bacterium]|nr:hypothetical protein [Gaiellaceae bacterium]